MAALAQTPAALEERLSRVRTGRTLARPPIAPEVTPNPHSGTPRREIGPDLRFPMSLPENPHRQRSDTRRRSSESKPKRKPKSGPWYWLAVVMCIVAVVGGYFWYTSARILQHPIAIDYGPADPPFPNALGPLVGAEFMTGNSVELQINGAEFFPSMLEAIRGAKKTITLETYIWTPGKVSEDFIFALMDAARAGVKVHVLVDGMGTLKFKDDDRDRLQEAGVEIYKYGRQKWWEVKPNINHRTHRKILVVDGRIGFTGGMCIDDSWDGDAENEKVWRETQVRVEGPTVRQMQSAFAANWLQTTSRLLLGEDYYPEVAPSGSVVAQCYKSGPADAPEYVRIGYLFAIAAARRTIDISQAYFVPDDLAVQTLIAARNRGVRVRIIVPAINDSRFGRAVSRSRWAPLLEAGVEIYQYLPAMYHPKTMSVDDTLVTIGSANFDNRSFSINDEVLLNVLDQGIGARHLQMFEADLKRSEQVTPEQHANRPFYIKAADHIAGIFRSQF